MLSLNLHRAASDQLTFAVSEINYWFTSVSETLLKISSINYVEIMSQSPCANKIRALFGSLFVFYDDGLSQTHRMVEGRRVCSKSSGPTPQSSHL